MSRKTTSKKKRNCRARTQHDKYSSDYSSLYGDEYLRGLDSKFLEDFSKEAKKDDLRIRKEREAPKVMTRAQKRRLENEKEINALRRKLRRENRLHKRSGKAELGSLVKELQKDDYEVLGNEESQRRREKSGLFKPWAEMEVIEPRRGRGKKREYYDVDEDVISNTESNFDRRNLDEVTSKPEDDYFDEPESVNEERRPRRYLVVDDDEVHDNYEKQTLSSSKKSKSKRRVVLDSDEEESDAHSPNYKSKRSKASKSGVTRRHVVENSNEEKAVRPTIAKKEPRKMYRQKYGDKESKVEVASSQMKTKGNAKQRNKSGSRAVSAGGRAIEKNDEKRAKSNIDFSDSSEEETEGFFFESSFADLEEELERSRKIGEMEDKRQAKLLRDAKRRKAARRNAAGHD